MAKAEQPDLLLWLSFFKENCPPRAHILCNKFLCPAGVVGASLIAPGTWRHASVKQMQTPFLLFCQYKTQEYTALQDRKRGHNGGFLVTAHLQSLWGGPYCCLCSEALLTSAHEVNMQPWVDQVRTAPASSDEGTPPANPVGAIWGENLFAYRSWAS